MKGKTRNQALRVREAFLTLPDAILLAKVLDWGSVLGVDQHEWEGAEEYAQIMGYQVQSGVTSAIYPDLGALFEVEEDSEVWEWLTPTPATIRTAVAALHAEDVYHLLVGYIGECLEHTTLTRAWGPGPGSMHSNGSGYDFMRYLAGYFRTLALPEPVTVPTEATTGTLMSQQDFSALKGFLRSEDGWSIPLPPEDPIEVSDEAWLYWEGGAYDELEYWERDAIQAQLDREQFDTAPAPVPEGCVCDGMLVLTQRWLVGHGHDVVTNVNLLQELDATCDCTVVTAIADRWPGPELRPPERAWDPFDRPKKKKKKGQKQKQKAKR